MTPRERLLYVMNGGIPDRVPVSPFVQEEFLSYYFNKSNTDRLIDAVKCAEELDFDLITKQYIYAAPYFMMKSYPNWEIETSTEKKDGNIYKITKVKTPSRELRHVEGAPYIEQSITGIHFSTIEYLIKDENDFEAFRKYCPEMGKQVANEIIEAGKFATKYIGTRGINCPWAIGSVYNLVSTYMDVQQLMMDALVEEDYYKTYMNFFADIVAKNYEVFAQSDYDCVGIQGNIANGSMMGEDFFNEHVLPYERRTLDILNAVKKPSIYHNCGNAKSLYPCYKELGITAWETIAPPPQGDNNLAEVKEYFGSSLILCGGLDQINFLKEATPEEVENAAAAATEIGKPGGYYIFAASDYLEKNTPIENIKAMIRGSKAAGKY
ncbi:MAG: hypothetical protein K0S71_2429 [Clostridia bacterium]|nr:hypothetical protein [Clostridia bacterium]